MRLKLFLILLLIIHYVAYCIHQPPVLVGGRYEDNPTAHIFCRLYRFARPSVEPRDALTLFKRHPSTKYDTGWTKFPQQETNQLAIIGTHFRHPTIISQETTNDTSLTAILFKRLDHG